MAKTGTVLLAALMGITISFADTPDWALKGSYVYKTAKVTEVNKDGIADLIKIDTGSESNLRIGAHCKILRDGLHVGDIVIVEADRNKSIGLALDGSVIQNGDAVRITPAN